MERDSQVFLALIPHSNRYSDEEVSDDEEEENFCQEEYYEHNLFFDTDDGEDEDAIIGDEPIFDEKDENDEEYDELLESGDTTIYLVERYQTSKYLGTEIEDHPKCEYDMPELVENVEYIDFIGIDEILYSCIPLTSILKELQVDQELVLFYAFKKNFFRNIWAKFEG